MKKSLLRAAFFIMTWPLLSFAGAVDLPQTGQITCYDLSGTVIDCAGTGQDGDIQAGVDWPSPRFEDNDDGTVTDNLTGLVWLKDASCLGLSDWESALDAVAGLNANPEGYSCSDYVANHDDWRLPNVVELESLVNAQASSPAAWLNDQGFSGVQPCGYWSATTCAYRTDLAWHVGMNSSGPLIYRNKFLSFYVWPVRAGQ